MDINIDQSNNLINGNRSIKRPKLKSSDESSLSINKTKTLDISNSHVLSTSSQTASLAVPLPCFIQSDRQQQQQQVNIPSAYTIDLNTLKSNGMNIILAPSASNISEPSLSSNGSIVLTLNNFSYQPS